MYGHWCVLLGLCVCIFVLPLLDWQKNINYQMAMLFRKQVSFYTQFLHGIPFFVYNSIFCYFKIEQKHGCILATPDHLNIMVHIVWFS